MRVAIFGSRGFVGSRIANEALHRGWTVEHIGSQTTNARDLVARADAVVHSVGSFMPDPQYKKLVNEPITACNLVQLATMKLGLAPSNPLTKQSFEELNFASLKSAADDVLETHKDATNFPFVFLSAADWGLADPEYIRSKRTGEAYLSSLAALRPVFLRPGFIAPPPRGPLTPRLLLDRVLDLTDSEYRVSVDAVAEAACDAIEDDSISGVIEAEVLKCI